MKFADRVGEKGNVKIGINSENFLEGFPGFGAVCRSAAWEWTTCRFPEVTLTVKVN